MPDQSNRSINIGGNASNNTMITGDGNVGRDQITTTSTTTTIGFQQQQDKDEFLKQLDELRTALREVKTEVAGISELDIDLKEEIEAEVLEQIKELKEAKESAVELAVGETPSDDVLDSINKSIENAGGVFSSIEQIGAGVTGLAKQVAPIIRKAIPMLASARHLIGLP
jgi:hypothetical protein